MWFPEGPPTSNQLWNFPQGMSSWRPLPSSADGFASALPRLERRVLEFWPRVHDKETWGFCVRTFLGYIDHFLNTGTMPLFGSLVDGPSDLPPLLREAYGVCAAYRTCKNAKKPFYSQLLNAAVNNMSQSTPTQTDLRRQLGRIQALVLYYIIFITGGISDKQLLPYLVRAVHSVIQFQRCDYIKYLVGLPVSTKSYAELCWEEFIDEREQASVHPISGVISYDEFVSDWEQGGLVQVDEFRHLLLVACKGVASVQERTPKEPVLTSDSFVHT